MHLLELTGDAFMIYKYCSMSTIAVFYLLNETSFVLFTLNW